MKVKVTTVEEIDISLDFPVYRRNTISFFKLVDNNIALRVTNCDICIEIEATTSDAAYSQSKSECTAEEFNEAYKQTLEKLTKLAQA